MEGKRALLYTGGVKSWSVISALKDLGIECIATGTRKSTQSDKKRIIDIMGQDALMLDEGGARLLIDTYHQFHADVMIAGGRNMYTSLKARLPFLHINQEREHAYAGYEGMIRLAIELCRTLEAPIWDVARSSAPWLSESVAEEAPATHLVVNHRG